MKILIAFAGKTGCSNEMCQLLAAHLPHHEVTVADLSLTAPDPTGFDHVVLGGSVRMGKLPRALRLYVAEHGAALAALPHTLFLLCAFADQFENYAEMLFPRALLDTADEVVYFGGELSVSRQRGFFAKMLTRMMRNSILESEDDDAALPGLLPEHVRLLADRLCGR
ncbi:MAG: hypothetical protein E7639_01385 [Ruminococcaceae bacterium]|nr:hypothetical protein [Oscillospiraceae bacterium]